MLGAYIGLADAASGDGNLPRGMTEGQGLHACSGATFRRGCNSRKQR